MRGRTRLCVLRELIAFTGSKLQAIEKQPRRNEEQLERRVQYAEQRLFLFASEVESE